MKTKKRLIFDTETYGLEEKIIFDIGYIVFDKHKEFARKNYLIKETFIPNKLVNLPFYGEKKVEKYLGMNIPVKPYAEVMFEMWELIKEHKVKEVLAYNLPFDLQALQATNKQLRGKDFRMFDNLQKTDVYTVFCNFVKDRKDFPRFCLEHGFSSQAGNLKTNAEVAYSFLTGDVEHVEDHTALSDVVEELYIYKTIKRRKKKYNMKAINSPWLLVDHNKENMKERRKQQ